MIKKDKLKITLIGAGSASFAPCTVNDILLNENLNKINLEICLMDIQEEALKISYEYTEKTAKALGKSVKISATEDLEKSLVGADFVITAIELDRYYYWSQDFHIPVKYGFRQVYGENGGPGGMFHTLRNIPPMLKIAYTMEKVCPEAWLLNYTNPEAKLVEAISKLTKIKVVGLCHGIGMGQEQLAKFLEIPEEDLDTVACGLNHFGWYQEIRNKKTGEDLYPVLREKEKKAQWLAEWDELALSRILLRTYGLYPYPGANHIGEYLGWSDSFLASAKLQYFYDPVNENPWETNKIPNFVYSFSKGNNPTEVPLYGESKALIEEWTREFRLSIRPEDLKPSTEFGIPIIEAITFDIRTEIAEVNMTNNGKIPGLPLDMVVELPAFVDGKGIHTKQMQPLPIGITDMIRRQGAIHQLVIEAYVEKSKNKLLQAVMLDPTVSTYNNAVAMINEMCETQKEILPELNW